MHFNLFEYHFAHLRQQARIVVAFFQVYLKLDQFCTMASGTTVSGGCAVTAGSGQCKGLEDAVSAHIKGKLESKYLRTMQLTYYIS